jgi:putative ABC transport system substrate-binding protein
VVRRISRRAFVSSLAALAMSSTIPVAPLGANAQQQASPRRIGLLLGIGGFLPESNFSPESKLAQQFRLGLVDAGYAEGRDVVIEWRSANGDYDRLPSLVAELIQRKVEVIVAYSTVAAQAAKRATSTIPIVLAVVGDPIGSGLVTNLAHPGGNITGLSMMTNELTAKRLQLLKDAIPRLTRVAVLGNPDAPYHPKAVEDLKAVAPSLAIELSFVEARTPEEFSRAVSDVSRAHAQALYVIDDALFFTHRTRLLKLVSKARLPAINAPREFADEGGLMSYGTNIGELWRRAAAYVDKILKGAKPGDLPIEQPTKFEFVVNLKTARAIGITIPESVLARADEVIR